MADIEERAAESHFWRAAVDRARNDERIYGFAEPRDWHLQRDFGERLVREDHYLAAEWERPGYAQVYDRREMGSRRPGSYAASGESPPGQDVARPVARTVGAVMRREVETLTPDDTAADAAEAMDDADVSELPVVDSQGRLIGIVSARDLVTRVVMPDRKPSDVRVAELVDADVLAATEDEPLTSALRIFAQDPGRHVPVVDREDRLLGMLSLAEVAAAARGDEALANALREIASRSAFWRGLR